MISLFIDTSTNNVSISLVKDGKILSSIEKDIPNMHSSLCTKYIKDCLDLAKIDANNIDNIMVVYGPGSFTGVRIGVTIAKTYGFLINRDVTPISSLQELAISANKEGIILSIIPANKYSYYVGLYQDGNLIDSEKCLNREEIIQLIKQYNPYIVGNTQNVIGSYKINLQKLDVLKIVDYYMDKEKINYHKLVPNYIKAPDVLEKKV